VLFEPGSRWAAGQEASQQGKASQQEGQRVHSETGHGEERGQNRRMIRRPISPSSRGDLIHLDQLRRRQNRTGLGQVVRIDQLVASENVIDDFPSSLEDAGKGGGAGFRVGSRLPCPAF